MAYPSTKVLSTPIDELSVDRAVIDFMQRHKLANLEALLEYGIPDLKKMEGFNDDILFHLMDLLHTANAMYRLSQWPKK